jgi:WD40 repeat protein/transcriptional regulator with XRE-family HTH domain
MSTYGYSERDYNFGQTITTLRTALGLTQAELAQVLQVSRRAVGGWETGSSYPKAEHLKVLIELCVQKQTFFHAGQEAGEIRTLWKAAHQKVLIDEQWLSALLSQTHPPLTLLPAQQSKTTQPLEPTRTTQPLPEPAQPMLEAAQPVAEPRIDWGDALAIPTFYGREQELALLEQWIVRERCRVISVLGMGGIGKSALSVSLMHQVAKHFQVVIFRSLRDTPSCETLLDDCLQMFSPQLLSAAPVNLERRISQLIEQLRKKRALIVLDNLESLLEEGDIKGRFREHLEGYEILLRRVAETEHHGCLLLTSREKPTGLRAAEGKNSPVRSLRLSGLDTAACEQLLAEKDMVGTSQDQEQLVKVYGGNPLALKIVAETITDLFGGEISQFLSGGAVIFGNISDLLSEHFARLSPLEQTVLLWLAITREAITIDELQKMLVTPLPRVQVLEAVDSLRRRSLIERGQRYASFTLHAVVLEYVTSALIEEMTNEIQQRQPLHRLIEFGLEQTNTKEYMRQTQQRLIVAPILGSLYNMYHGRGEVEEQLRSVLEQLRQRANHAQGYGPANLITLLHSHRGHLRDLDLSQLSIRGARLQGVEMQDTSLVGANLHDTLFTEALDAAWSVVISNNDQYWAAGSRRGEVRVWHQGGQVLHLVWQAHNDNVYALAFSPDGSQLASGSWDGTVKLWELEHGTLLWTGWHSTKLVSSVVFSPDGRALASGGDDGMIRFWDVATGKNVHSQQQPGPVLSLAWSPDGNLLASSNIDGSIRLWQYQGTQPITCVAVLTGHTNWVFRLAFSPDGSQLASGSWDGTVKLWDVASGQERQTLTGHTDRVYTVAWSPDGSTIASAGFDKTIWLWDVEQSRYRAALRGHKAVIYTITFTPDSSHLLSSSEDSTLRLWDVEHGQCEHIREGYAVSLYGLAWSPDDKYLASGGSDMQVTIWDAVGEMAPKILRGHSWAILGVTWSPDGKQIASCGPDNTIRLWDAATGALLHIFRDPDYDDPLFYDVEWSPNGLLLASGSYLHGIQVWDVQKHTSLWVGHAHATRVRRVAWSPDSTRLASCGDDGSICLWEVSSGTLQKKLQGHHGGVASAAWSPDGTQLASGGSGQSSGELFVWDAHNGQHIQSLIGHGGSVFAVTWNRQGDLLVSGDTNGVLRWWEPQSRTCLMRREGHNGAVYALKISHDGHLLASAGDDGTIRLWDCERAEPLRKLHHDRPYERLNITGIRGLTVAQKATLRTLGAIERRGS